MFNKDQQLELPIEPEEPRGRRWALWFITGIVLLVICGAAALASYGYFVLTKAPDDFPIGERIVIEPGTSVPDVVRRFHEAGVVRSKQVLYLTLVGLHDTTEIKASSYRFTEPLDVFQIADRLTEGDFDTDLIRFVHYEGERVELIADRAEALLPEFDTTLFLSLALPFEGKLFPDTYLIPQNYTAEDLVTLLRDAYESRVGPLRPAIEASGWSEDEVIIMASLIEREANTRQSMRLVAGIIQKRLEIEMPLQVDASMEYVLKKPLSQLTASDLDMDTPYNTYLNPGLPPTPIGNPGLMAIEAVLEPEESPYLFYLTGRDGQFYYGRNYAEHRLNIAQHLR